MPVNFNLLRQAGPANFAEGLMQGQDQQNALLQQQQQRQLSDIQLRNALRGEQEAMAESEAVKGSASLEDLAGRYRKAGLGKQALATEAALAKQRTDKLAAAKSQFELLKTSATRIMSNPTAAVSELQRYQQLTGVDMSDDIAQVQGMAPEQIKAWAAGHALEADKLLPQFREFSTPAGGKQIGAVNPVTGAFTAAQTLAPEMTPAQIKQDERDRQRLALEGRRVGLEQERVGIARTEADRKTQGLEALPPKEIQKREAVLPQATAAMKGFEAKSVSFVNDLIALRDHPGLSQITGLVAGRVPALTADGRAAQALYDKVVAKGGFQALQDMRDASKTGGALGNVSNQEGKQLTASFAAIDRKQDAPDVKAAINTAISDIEGANVRMKEAYDSTYAYKAGAPAAASAIPKISGNADYDKLPSGAVFIGPDGQQRRKP